MQSEIQSAFQIELQRLETTAAEIERQLENLRKIPRYQGRDISEQALEHMREMKRRNLAVARDEPYFGRIDFQESETERIIPLYIGKIGIEQEASGQPLVIDWRAPVASIFYSFAGGEEPVSYESPDGTVEGVVHLKRNLVIRKQVLLRVVDSYVRGSGNLTVSDEFLLYRLEENKDNRLRDIVSTIQAEQDRIIRAEKNTALIIQGVAGSGKTTVALHRLAYLLYQYREQVRAEKMVIFAPNRMFLDYISNVLPELGVGGIQQTTFTAWAMRLLDNEVQLADPSDRLRSRFDPGKDRTRADEEPPGRFKGSIRFLRYVRECLDRYEATLIPQVDFHAWEGAVLPADRIREWFYEEYRHYPLAQRRERLAARIKRWLEMELGQIPDEKKKDLKKKATQRLRAYLKQIPAHSPFEFYKLLFQTTMRPVFLNDQLVAGFPRGIMEMSSRIFERNEVELEDLAPLVYIRNRFYGISGQDSFDHVVIDEAQDFSPFQIALLKEITRGNSFTILGDLSQGIHSYQGIHDWQEFLDLFGQQEAAFHVLNRSYRSTMEIIHFANEIISRSGEPVVLAQPFFRSGEKVKLSNITKENRVPAMLKAIRHLQNNRASTVAVIGRTEEECRELHDELRNKGLDAVLIHSRQSEYLGGISVIPVYLAKGLEFDAVLLIDVDEDHYGPSAQDAKLLYVGCTRALHKLWLLYSGEPSPLIRNLDKELFDWELFD